MPEGPGPVLPPRASVTPQPFEPAARYAGFRAGVFASAEIPSLRDEPGDDPDGAGSELEWQARWFSGEFGRDFVGRDGERIEIVQFGHWNRAAGPDFTDAAVRIDGGIRRGPIEVDLAAADWETHGHGTNPEFDEVVLHVHFDGRRAGAPRFFTRTSAHRAVAQLPLDRSAVDDLPQHWGHLPVARRGRCATPLRDLSPGALESLLVSAAHYRLLRKARRFAAMADAHTAQQALFQSIAEALGYRHNRLTMAVLAQRLPLAALRRRGSGEREALLFGAAGFLDPRQFEAATEAESRRYLKSLWDRWWKERSHHEPEAASRRLRWRMAGCRPGNHPHRRVAALAVLLDRWAAFRRLAACPRRLGPAAWIRATRDHLAGLRHPYWERHYTLRARPADAPVALIGRDRALDLLGNVLIPAAFPNRPDLWDAYRELPGAVGNESLHRAALRLFGPDAPRIAAATRRYWQQQALLQIYRDFCLRDASDCSDCPFPEQLTQWGEG